MWGGAVPIVGGIKTALIAGTIASGTVPVAAPIIIVGTFIVIGGIFTVGVATKYLLNKKRKKEASKRMKREEIERQRKHDLIMPRFNRGMYANIIRIKP